MKRKHVHRNIQNNIISIITLYWHQTKFLGTVAQSSSHIKLTITYTKVFPAKMWKEILDAINEVKDAISKVNDPAFYRFHIPSISTEHH